MNHHLKAARWFARVMDNQFSLFGVSFGLDAIIGMIPGFGDLLSMFFSLYLLWIGMKMGVPIEKLNVMLRNIIIDTVVGLIPFLGDIADIFIQSNVKNLNILEEFAAKRGGGNVIEGEVL